MGKSVDESIENNIKNSVENNIKNSAKNSIENNIQSEIEDYYWYWICNIPTIGNTKIRSILNVFSDVREVYDASEKLLGLVPGLKENEIARIIESKRDTEVYKSFIAMKDKGIRFVHQESKDYPQRLKKIYDSPFGIYYKGRLPKEEIPSVAIIGARDCTNYGREIANMFGYEFSKLGVQIISGMARGIDSYGHSGAVSGGGNTFGVLGCGVDICYPKENIEIYMNILENGGIISEYPPGTKPLAYQFPMRNRIISGLADVVIVVEAREKSGSLITVDQALEQNKEVMVVPGRIGDMLSEGCNNLIKLGAQIITKPQDAFENLGFVIENILNSNGNLTSSTNHTSKIDNCIPTHKIDGITNMKDSSIGSGTENKIDGRMVDDKVGNMTDNIGNYIGDYIKNSTDDTCNHNITLASHEKKVYSCVDLFPKNLNIIIEETGLNTSLVTDILLNLELRNYIREVSKNNYVRVIAPQQILELSSK